MGGVGGGVAGVVGVGVAGGVGEGVAGVGVGVAMVPNWPDSIMLTRLCKSRPGKICSSCGSKESRYDSGRLVRSVTCFRRLGAASDACSEILVIAVVTARKDSNKWQSKK